MKYFLFFIISISSFLKAYPAIMKIDMNENVPLDVPMHAAVTLTIQFPYIIDGLHGAGFTPDITKAAGEFLISYTAPNNYFSLYPLSDISASRNLNVVVKNKIYVLRPYLVADPNKAWTVLIFDDPEKNKQFKEPHPRIYKNFLPPKRQLESSTTAKIIGLIDTAKMLSQVEESILNELLNVMPHISISLRKNDIQQYETHRIFLDIVLRHNKFDVLVFGLRVINISQEDIVFNPESFTVRCGEYVYPQVISDFQGKVKPGESAIGYFAIIGTSEGSPNFLSPNNEFRINIDYLNPNYVPNP